MRSIPRRKILGLALAATGLLLAFAGFGASFAFQPTTTTTPVAASETRTVSQGGLIADVGLDIHALGIEQSPSYHVDPALVRSSSLPALSVHRDVEGPALLPVGVGAHLALATGADAARASTTSGAASVATVSSTPVLSPATTAILAAAAFAGAGLLAYFGAGLKKILVLPFVALYAKISRSEVFENEVRERIFQAIKASPGRSASDLAKDANVAWGTTIYHLDVLEQTRMVTSIREGRHRRYFENGAALSTTKETVALLCNRVTATVAQRVRESPGLTQKDLASATEMTPQALHWHLTRLVGAGLVRKEREGRVVRHFVG
jgi:DNA-binding transcriptional ArsR family regulator